MPLQHSNSPRTATEAAIEAGTQVPEHAKDTFDAFLDSIACEAEAGWSGMLSDAW